MIGGIFAAITFVSGVVALAIGFFASANEIAYRASDNLIIDCTFKEFVPVFLQKGDILRTYIIQKNKQTENYTMEFGLLNDSNQLVERGSNLSRFEAKADGFYRFELISPNCAAIKNFPITLSTVIEVRKTPDLAGLQGIGSALLGLTGGIVIGLLQNRFKWKW